MPPYLVKPPSPGLARPEWSQGLLLACPLSRRGGVVRDLSGSGRDGALTGGAYGYGTWGEVRQHTATTDRVNFGPATWLPTNQVTILLQYRKRDATLRASGAVGVTTATVAQFCTLYLPWTSGAVFFDWGGTTAGTSRLSVSGLTFGDDVWIATVGPRGQEVWQNGRLVGTATGVTRTATSSNWSFGGAAAQPSDLADYGCHAVWDRQLPISSILALSADPFLPWREADDLPYLAGVTLGGGAALPDIIDDEDARYSETAGWAELTGLGTAYNGDARYAASGSGSVVATWDTGYGPGPYEVLAAWHHQLDGATGASGAPYRIYDGATLLATVRVDQTAPPSGTSYGGVPFQRLGAWFVTTGPLKVTLADDANGYVFADAILARPALAGRAEGSSGVIATLGRAASLAGSALGRAAVAASIVAAGVLAGSAGGRSSAHGMPVASLAPVGIAAGRATAAATPTGTATLAGRAEGRATTIGALEGSSGPPPEPSDLVGRAEGRSSNWAALSAVRVSAGSSAGTSVVAALPSRTAPLVGRASGAASTSAAPRRAATALGRSDGRSIVSALLRGLWPLSGRAEGSSSARAGGPAPAPPEPAALTLREGLVARLRESSALADRVGARIYAGFLPQGRTPPAVTYEVVADDEVRLLAGPTDYGEARVSFGCWGRTPGECVGVSSALRSTLAAMTAGGMDCDLGGVVVRWCRRDPEQEQTFPLQDGTDKNRWLFEVVYLVNYRSS